MLRLGLLIAAVILFIIAALPPVPYHGSLLAAGLACWAASELAGAV
jgi:hypothetical protein